MKILVVSLFVLATQSHAGDEKNIVDLSWRLKARNLLTIAKQHSRPYFRDRDVQYRLSKWLAAPVNRPYVAQCQRHLGNYIHSRNVLGALCWAKRQDNNLEIKWLLTHYYLDLALSLLEISQDPRYDDKFKTIAASFLGYFADYDYQLVKLTACFKRRQFVDIADCLRQDFTLVKRPKGHIYLRLANDNSFYHNDFIPYFSINTAQTFPFHAGHAMSETGWIAGNSTRYLTTTRTDTTLGEQLNNTSNLVADNYPFAKGERGSLTRMYRALRTKGFIDGAFTEEGFKLIVSDNLQQRDPVWNQDRGVYYQARRLIDSAKETIFIDMFALGGVIGVSLAKHLLSRLQVNDNLKVFILRDTVNHFGGIAEQMPVYNFLLAYSYLFPDRLIVSESYIYGHTSGLPAFLKSVIDDRFVKLSGIQGMLDLAVQAVSDHSKLMVVDGKGAEPKAIVSSKNWSDRAGVIFFDDAVLIEGPAAAVVQDDFYHDMRLGLREVMAKKFIAGAIFGQPSYIDRLYQGQQKHQTVDYKISEILKDFDLLERDANLVPRRTTPVVYSFDKSVDKTVAIRTGYNSVDSSTTNIIDQNIQAILHARKNIYINEQFCFDVKVVTALLNVKSKRPKLDIRLILDHALETEPDGIPNILYIDLLLKAGIDIRWKKTQWIGNIPQKNHSKTLSVDGKYVIVGSANKDAMTMFGSFRDQQVEVFDPLTVAQHDKVFLEWWNNVDPEKKFPASRKPFEKTNSYDSEYVMPYNIVVPKHFVDLEGNRLSPKSFLRLIRGIVKILYDYIVI